MSLIIREIPAEETPQYLQTLGTILHDTVHDGASVGFILPFSENDAADFWKNSVLPAQQTSQVALYGAWLDGRLVGTGQLVHATMPNQQHRADLAKILVHPGARRQGIARQLMEILIERARQEGKKLLTLDTRTGDMAEPLYFSLGFQIAGTIPDYCRAPDMDRLDGTTYMYLKL